MPRYFFSIQAADKEIRAEYAAELKDDAAALAYACEIIRHFVGLCDAAATLIDYL